jgi:hypothetical protein
MAVGHPTDYEEAAVKKAVGKYVVDCKKQSFLPTIEGLAVHLNVARKTIYNWADEHPEFLHILEQLKAAQASQLIQNGLVGVYNSTITKLMLTKHDYTDKQDITTEGKALPTPIYGGQSLPNKEHNGD